MTKILRVYPAYIKDEPEIVLKTDQTFIEVWAALGKSRTEAINEIFTAGLDRLAESKELEGKIDKRGLAIFRKWQKLRVKIIEKEQLEFIYEQSTLEEFKQFCEENEIDHESFLKDYQLHLPTPRAKSKIMEDWIGYMLAENVEVEVDEIRQAAEMEGVITNEDDWNLMKNIASRKGYSGNAKRGYWKLVNS